MSGSCHAVDPAKDRGRPTRRQAGRSARDCRGLPGPHRREDGYTLRFRVCLSSTSCQGRVPDCPALLRVSVVSRDGFLLYSAVSLSLAFAHRCHPVQGQEIPELDMSYCDPHRHPLSPIPAPARRISCLRSPRRSPELSPRRCSRARRVSGMDLIGYEPRLRACGCVDLCNAPSSGAIRALSYPETWSFLQCRVFQVSPRTPAASLPPHQPCSAERVVRLPYTPRARLHSLSLHARTGSPRGASRFLVAQHPPARLTGKKSGSNGALQLRAPVATWRALLEAPRYGGNWGHVGDVPCRSWRTDVPSRACVFGSLAGCLMRSRVPLGRSARPHEATRRACASRVDLRAIFRCPVLRIAIAPRKSWSIMR